MKLIPAWSPTRPRVVAGDGTTIRIVQDPKTGKGVRKSVSYQSTRTPHEKKRDEVMHRVMKKTWRWHRERRNEYYQRLAAGKYPFKMIPAWLPEHPPEMSFLDRYQVVETRVEIDIVSDKEVVRRIERMRLQL